jgi:hypothetical protein
LLRGVEYLASRRTPDRVQLSVACQRRCILVLGEDALRAGLLYPCREPCRTERVPIVGGQVLLLDDSQSVTVAMARC